MLQYQILVLNGIMSLFVKVKIINLALFLNFFLYELVVTITYIIYIDGLEINSTNWYLNLKLENLEEEIKSVVKNFEYEDNVVEDLIMAANIHIIPLTSEVRGQLIDSKFFSDGYPAYRNAELITEVSRLINDKYCQMYKHKIIPMKLLICIN